MRYEKNVILKNGKPCLLRGADGDDAGSVYSVFVQTHAQTDFLLSYPDEITMTEEEERQYLEEQAKSSNAIEICAYVDGIPAGTGGISPVGTCSKLVHRASFGVAVDKSFWGLGIGRALTQASLECAKAAGYSQVELDVVAENQSACSLYRSLGFREYGRKPKGFRSRSGQWQELILMYLDLNDLH